MATKPVYDFLTCDHRLVLEYPSILREAGLQVESHEANRIFSEYQTFKISQGPSGVVVRAQPTNPHLVQAEEDIGKVQHMIFIGMVELPRQPVENYRNFRLVSMIADLLIANGAERM